NGRRLAWKGVRIIQNEVRVIGNEPASGGNESLPSHCTGGRVQPDDFLVSFLKRLGRRLTGRGQPAERPNDPGRCQRQAHHDQNQEIGTKQPVHFRNQELGTSDRESTVGWKRRHLLALNLTRFLHSNCQPSSSYNNTGRARLLPSRELRKTGSAGASPSRCATFESHH